MRKTAMLAPLLALTLLHCAETQPYTRVAPAEASLEVVNRTPDDLTVTVRGRVEGLVRSGERVRYRHFVRGPAELVATPREPGVRGAHVWREERDLGANPIEIWEIVAKGAEGAEIAVPAPLAALTVDNPSRHPVAVTVDGRRVGQVFPRESRTFDDLAAGPHHVVATAEEGALSVSADVALIADADNTWAIAFAGAKLDVVNDTSEPVTVSIDGTARTTLEAGATWTSSDEQPGLRVVTAVSLVTRHPWQAALDLSTASPTQWRLGTSGATLIIDNRSGEAVTVTVPGKDPVELANGGRAEVPDLPVGAIAPVGTGADTHQRYGAELEIGGGQRYTWTLLPIQPTLRVVNRTPQTLIVYVAGDRRGSVAANATVLLENLPERPFEAELVDEHGTSYYHDAVDPALTPASSWVVNAVTGSVSVVNDRPETVDLYLDGRPLAALEAKSERTFGGAPVGERLVEARGRRSGAVLRAHLTVTEEAPAVARFEDPLATLEIANRLGVELRPTGPLADQHAAIPAGATLRFAVPARRATWVLLGPDGAPLARDGAPTAAEVVRWDVVPGTTALIVWNQLAEDVAVVIDDRAVGTVAAGETESFDGVATGRHRFEAVETGSGHVRALVQVAAPDKLLKWTLAVKPGRVLVQNQSAERIQVEIDGSLYDAVEPRATKAFAGMVPGRHEVVGYGDASGVKHGFGATVVEGADTLLTVTPPMGVLVVDNQSGQDLAVRVDGVLIGRLAKDAAPTPLPAPAGKRLVQVERLGDRTVSGSELIIAADHAIHLPVPRLLVRLVLVNQTAEALSVRVGDRVLATVAAGGSLMEESVPAGQVELTAVASDGRVTHVERRKLHAGETATWVLQQPR